MPVLFLTHVLKKKKTCFIDPRGENLFFSTVLLFLHITTLAQNTHTHAQTSPLLISHLSVGHQSHPQNCRHPMLVCTAHQWLIC